jgi:hypothetical protein
MGQPGYDAEEPYDSLLPGPTGPTGPAGSIPNIALSILTPTINETIAAGWSAVLVRSLTVTTGLIITVLLGARLRVL